MGLFESAWKTEDRTKKDKAVQSVFRIRNAGKLNEIILSAPLIETKCAAIGQLKSIVKDQLPFDRETCQKILLSLSADRIIGSESGDWYISRLFAALSDHEKYAVAVDAEDVMIRGLAVESISWNSDELLRIIRNAAVSDELGERAVRRISDKALLDEIISDVSLPENLREIAGKTKSVIEQSEQRKKEEEELQKKRLACARGGHQKKFVEYVSRGNGGKDILYVCENCGAEILEPYEWSSADSV